MSERYAFTLRDGHREARGTYAQRDLRFLGGPLLPEAHAFVQAFGLWDNFRVATGMDTQAWTTRRVAPLLDAARALRARLQRESDVLGYDYLYSFPEKGIPKGAGAASGFTVFGDRGLVDASVPGQLYVTLRTPTGDGTSREAGLRDLRRETSVPTSWGPLKVHRRTRPIAWLDKLALLTGFLEQARHADVQVRHHFANEPPDTERRGTMPADGQAGP